jgi:hypothetical protein
MENVINMVLGGGSGVLGVAFPLLGAMEVGFLICSSGASLMDQYMNEMYLKNGNSQGLYVINVSSPGAYTKSALFLASDNSFLGWYGSSISGAPTIPYYWYQRFLNSYGY